MNWFKRIALALSLPLAFAADANPAHAAADIFSFIGNVSATGYANPVATFNPGGVSCQLGNSSLIDPFGCLVRINGARSITISIALPAGLQIIRWGGLCAPAGTATSAVIGVPANEDEMPSCSVTIGPVPAAAPQTGWWWAPTESGSGYAIAVNGDDKMFIALFGYRENGQPLWRIANAARAASTNTARIYRGTLQEMASGGTLAGGEPGNAQPVNASIELTATFSASAINYPAPTTGTLTLRNTATNATESKVIRRFPINGSTVAAAPANALWTGWYWNPNQPGVGYFVEQQGSNAFVGTFAYDTTGAPIWYISSAGVVPTAAGYQLNAPLNAFTGGSPFGARPPVNTPTLVPAGSMISNLAQAGAALQLSTGRNIPLSPFSW